MLQMIINWIIKGISELLELIIDIFMDAIGMDIDQYITTLPFLSTGYNILRGISIGLVLILAALSLIKFTMPSVIEGEQRERPITIIFYAMVAGALCFMGNKILVVIVNLVKPTYDTILGIDATNLAAGGGTQSAGAVVANLISTGIGVATGMWTGLEKGALLLELVITALIGYNLFKLMLEIFERYMLVGIMLYTSPPFFAMIASNSTRESFWKWLKMFINACIMMVVSLYFLKLVFSGFGALNTASLASAGTAANVTNTLTGGSFETLIKLLMILATLKIGQRADELMNQMGLSVAKTGTGLFEDMMLGMRTAGKQFASGGSGAGTRSDKKTALGKSGFMKGTWIGTGIDAITAAPSEAKKGFADGGIKQAVKNVGSSSKEAWKDNKKSAGSAAYLNDKVKQGVTATQDAVISANAIAQTGQPLPDSLHLKQSQVSAHTYDRDAMDANALRNQEVSAANTAKYTAHSGENSGLRKSIQGKYATQVGDKGNYVTPKAAGGTEATRNYTAYGAVNPETGASYVTMDGDPNTVYPSAEFQAAGGYNNSDAVKEAVAASGCGSATEGFNDAQRADFYSHMSDAVEGMSESDAQDIAFDPRIDESFSGESEGVAQAIAQNGFSDIIPKGSTIESMQTWGMPDVQDRMGNNLDGGRAVMFTTSPEYVRDEKKNIVKDESGNPVSAQTRTVAIDECGYTAMQNNGANMSAWEKVETGGHTYYYNQTEIRSDMPAEPMPKGINTPEAIFTRETVQKAPDKPKGNQASASAASEKEGISAEQYGYMYNSRRKYSKETNHHVKPGQQPGKTNKNNNQGRNGKK